MNNNYVLPNDEKVNKIKLTIKDFYLVKAQRNNYYVSCKGYQAKSNPKPTIKGNVLFKVQRIITLCIINYSQGR